MPSAYWNPGDGSVWPLPRPGEDTRLGQVEWDLRHCVALTRESELLAASVLAAYAYLILDETADAQIKRLRQLRREARKAVPK